jgi:uncharacterized membrane protein
MFIYVLQLLQPDFDSVYQWGLILLRMRLIYLSNMSLQIVVMGVISSNTQLSLHLHIHQDMVMMASILHGFVSCCRILRIAREE